MARNCDNEIWVQSNSTEHDQEDEEEEALSLCDLPTNEEHYDNNSRKEPAAAQATKNQEDFDFGSWAAAAAEMCAADDVFFRGRILPLRYSISSESGLAKFQLDDSANITRPGIARSASMDHCHSGGFMTNGASSRSSSVGSHNSASSGSTSTTTTLPPNGYKPKIRNQFHSHPSPNPQIRIPNNRRGNAINPNRKSTMWRFFQVGLLRTPEIELNDLKVRSKNNTIHHFGSRNSSTSTSTSSSISNNIENKRSTTISKRIRKENKLLHSGLLFGSSCKCSVATVPLNNFVIVKNSDKGEKDEIFWKNKKKSTKNDQNQGKQAMSRHRTFEWLKQLSLQEDHQV